jgi:site-specific recombinase XerD
MPDQKSDLIKKEFIKYLDSLGLSPASHKNYRSDLGHFIAWALLKVRSFGSYVESLTEIVPFLSHNLGHEYRSYMTENLVPAKTMNRRLSTLRHLSRFLVENHSIDEDFTEGIENISMNTIKKSKINPVFDEFKAYLVDEKVSPNTIKNYLSDIRHFLVWLESNPQNNQTTN